MAISTRISSIPPAPSRAPRARYGLRPQNNRTTLQKPVWDLFLPRAGFAWSIRNDTVIRGGIGFFAYNYSMDLYGGEGGAQMGFGATSQGNISDPASGAGDIGWISGTGNSTPLYLSSSATMMANALPYIQGSKNPASYTTNPVFSPPSRTLQHQAGRDLGMEPHRRAPVREGLFGVGRLRRQSRGESAIRHRPEPNHQHGPAGLERCIGL